MYESGKTYVDRKCNLRLEELQCSTHGELKEKDILDDLVLFINDLVNFFYFSIQTIL